MSDEILRIPIWLGDNLLSFKYSKKITLTSLFEKQDETETHRLCLTWYNKIPTHPEEQHLPFKQTGTTTIFSFRYQSCVWPRSDPFIRQNPCSGCNSGIDLVVALEYTFFQLWSNAQQISARLARFRRSYVKCCGVVLTTSQVTQRFWLICAALFKVVTFLFLQLFIPDDSVLA